MVENRQGEVKNSIGNVEAKELICMTHGHELKWGECRWERVCRVEGNKRGETGEEVQGIRSINCRHKIDRGRLRIVWEMEKPKNLYV